MLPVSPVCPNQAGRAGRFSGTNPPVDEPVDEFWPELLRLAREEVAKTIRALPNDLRPHAEGLAVTYEAWPSEALIADGWDDDLLGMFVGDPLDVESPAEAAVPRQIQLFLENLWDFAEGDEEIYREEVRITYIHEFGHYLGLDEAELEKRGLQ
jgi:predicted Zn-dependent protease with MMP-like domain